MKLRKTIVARIVTHPLFARYGAAHPSRGIKLLRWVVRRVRLVAPWVVVGVLANGIVLGLYGFYLPTEISYDYESRECVRSIAFLPAKDTTHTSQYFDVQHEPMLSVLGLPILSTKLCVAAVNLPDSGAVEAIQIRQFGIPFDKSLTVRSGEYPSILPRLLSQDKLSVDSNLVFDVEDAERHAIMYVLRTGEKDTECLTQESVVVCKTREFALGQGLPYEFVLSRGIGANYKTAFSKTLTTVEPLSVVSQSIEAGSTIYDKTAEAVIAFSHPLKSHFAPILTNTATQSDVPVTSRLSEDATQMFVSWDAELPRGDSYLLKISQASKADGGYLEKPIAIPFTLSRGPTVVDIDIGTYGVDRRLQFVMTFDQELDPNQNFAGSVSVSSVPDLVYTVDAKTLSVSTNTALDACVAFTVSVTDAVISPFGINGGGRFEHSSRTLCQEIGSIGESVEGRSITSYSFGSGDNVVLFVGATHGNEKSSSYVLRSWVDHLEQNPSSVPSSVRAVIIPVLNPDGLRTDSRTNARNVDLNRNFPADNWKQSVKMPDGAVLPFGGGEVALSEPESSALAIYVQNVQPAFVVTYHSQGGIVMANGAPSSFDIAELYADMTGYGDESYSSASAVFTHDTTGAFEDWLKDKQSVPAILVELQNHYDNVFWNHRDAMLAILSRYQ